MQQHPRRNDARLTALLEEVKRSRVQVRAQQGLSSTSSQLAQCYDALADALEAYAAEASESGVPLPYRVRDEMRLCRAMSHLSQRSS
jgi:hypothetical protein